MRYKNKSWYESAKAELRVSIQCGTHVLTYEKTTHNLGNQLDKYFVTKF